MTYRDLGREMTAEEQEERTSWLASVLEEYLRGALVAEAASHIARDDMPERWRLEWRTRRLPELIRYLLNQAGDDGRVEMERRAKGRSSVLTIGAGEQYTSIELYDWVIDDAADPAAEVWKSIFGWVDAWINRVKP